MMPYKIGYCPCCTAPIMTADARGVYNAFKPTYRQVNLTFDSGGQVRTAMCSKCVENGFNKEKLIDTICHEGTEACNKKVSNHIKSLGCIKGYHLADSFQGNEPMKKKGKVSTADTGVFRKSI